MKKPTNKVIVVTGASRGLGLALARFLEDENTVIRFARSLEEDGATAFRVDVGKRDQVKAAMDKVAEKYGRIDILINNAGYGLSGATELIPEEEVRAIVDTNYLGALWCAQCALPYMSSGAKIINVASASGVVPMVYRALYNSTKAALISLSTSLHMETSRFGVGVTSVIMGAIDTKFSDNRHKVKYTNERYGDSVARGDAFVDSRGSAARMNVLRMAKKIANIAAKKRVTTQYIPGAAYKFGAAVQRTFPRLCIYIMEKVFGSKLIKMITDAEMKNEEGVKETEPKG